MKTRSRSSYGLLMALGLIVARPATAGVPSEEQQELEAALLHQHLELGDVRQYRQSKGSWLPLPATAAKVTVVSLWSPGCKPCLDDFPLLRELAQRFSDRPAVQFLFVADPPMNSSDKEVLNFWTHPVIEVGEEAVCPEQTIADAMAGSCRVELPSVAPARSFSHSLAPPAGAAWQPVTLVVDEHRVVRQLFVGPIGDRRSSLMTAIDRLLTAQQHGPTAKLRRRAGALPQKPRRHRIPK